MSKTSEQTPDSVDDELSADERSTFEFLAERFEGEPIGEICEFVLQSSSREEAN